MIKRLFFILLFILGISALKTGATPPDSVIVMSEINIFDIKNSSLNSSTGSINLLSSENIEKIETQNPSDYINTIPGVFMQSGTLSTNRITIRGIGSRTPYNTNRIHVYFKNIPITSSDGVSSPEEILTLPSLNVQIQKGPSSALMGSGLGGAIKITPSQSPRTSISTGISSYKNTLSFT